MSEHSLTRPERAAQVRQAKRYRAAMRKAGYCAACKHRDRENVTAFGLNICSVGQNRIYEHCQKDGRQPKFEFDETVLEKFRDAA